ncbi:MAG TPA: hypothetical protein VLN49_24555 [Gemmatimonadaceae bacterium]|nr:hypothetical protein [Gemmatimonadaceae bacterium]
MRFPLLASAAVLTLAAACTDDRPNTKSALTTAPQRPALTMSTLSKDASTVCVASVRQRDLLIANPKTTADSPDLAALNAVVDDVCQ